MFYIILMYFDEHDHYYLLAYLAVEGRRMIGVEDKMPNIFKCLEADVLGGRLGSKK